MIEIALTVLIYVVAFLVFLGGVFFIVNKWGGSNTNTLDYLSSSFPGPVVWETKTTKTTTTKPKKAATSPKEKVTVPSEPANSK